ncbi:electron transfer flavoprotein subunit YgcR [Lachnospiraceae bacterium]|uniref:electron transfer flavoprotein subunit beta/FixA family protein n=2 Tax=Bacteria TaxID=2 RepID=UPI001AA0FCCB|nr:electron transfer flavoprotein subunit beta/FixA family protein [Extibacter sp. GGCC_0201]MBO1722363.1 electron transfer flavoprotein subunit beta/FixA family protein [Extibacter sp. GGCC_0201]BDF32769.1 electron transfer flavoprotein subunit YgcR [Lachnospiraceae bacterium]BDF36774.1 electron transfer flavoprotein subunit YgcR [Lachnospiraceae bacterium]
MKILGCFKIVPDLDLIAEEDWIADGQLQVDTSYAKLLWNCFDEGALEMMLKLSDLSEGFDVVYELNALTVGRRRHETFLKTLYALGFEHAVRAEAEEDVDIRFCPEVIAHIVADYVSETAPQDVVIMGTQSSDGGNMKTPLLLAETLGWPCITQVTGIEPVDEGHLKVTNEEDGRVAEQVVAVPCVLAMGNAPSAYLRVPTLKDKMKLGKKPIEHIQPDWEKILEQGTDQAVELTRLEAVDDSRDTVLIEGDTPEEKARELYESYLKGRLDKI